MVYSRAELGYYIPRHEHKECVICFVPIADDKQLRMKCPHGDQFDIKVYGFGLSFNIGLTLLQCIEKVLANNNACPLCRSPII